VVVAPRVLGMADDQFATSLEFLENVRRAALGAGSGVFVDLRETQYISAVVCMMLSAEIERCKGLKFNSVKAVDPRAPAPSRLLRSMGFHRCLGIGGVRKRDETRIIEIRSGGKDAEVAKELEGVAAVAARAYGDQAFANRVHGVLNEAMLNVHMHAYDPELFRPDEALEGRWWVAGLVDPDQNEVFFFAYDHGVGIARTAPRTMGEDLQIILDHLLAALGLGRADASDHHIIEAAIKTRRSRTGLAQHGKGLSSMVQLVERAGRGSVWIRSGAGQYLYSNLNTPSGEPLEGSSALEYRVPGTLIIWRLRKPSDGAAAA
jgi:hypothetical protein